MPHTVFDNPGSLLINDARRDFLDNLIQSLGVEFKTAIDVGCGVGYFTTHLVDRGMVATGIDVREENIQEAQSRHPGIDFSVVDIEEHPFRKLGEYDLALCFGLLYHLENPFRALRNLYSLTGNIAVLETIVYPSNQAVAALREECLGQDQGVNYIALIPSESSFIRMLYAAGFSFVYHALDKPQHDQFQSIGGKQSRRTILIASKVSLSSPLLQEARLLQIPEWSGTNLQSTNWVAGNLRAIRRRLQLRTWLRRFVRASAVFVGKSVTDDE